MIEVACSSSLWANSPVIRSRQRSSITSSSMGVDRFGGGPPALSHDEIVAGW